MDIRNKLEAALQAATDDMEGGRDAAVVAAKGPGFTMVTCDANDLVAPIHPKAMVTILPEADWDLWLGGPYEDVVALQRPYPADRMTVRGPVFPTREKAA